MESVQIQVFAFNVRMMLLIILKLRIGVSTTIFSYPFYNINKNTKEITYFPPHIKIRIQQLNNQLQKLCIISLKIEYMDDNICKLTPPPGNIETGLLELKANFEKSEFDP
eukprot:snap_masked-scaffold_26-processed-gene-4.27-mRNA-1 protein AED:1.00 eAED:1.00 QI:0/0/0/0/1/1/2/0/109